MGKIVSDGAQLKCSMGSAPSMFSVIIPMRPTVGNKPMANMQDFVPMANVKPFGTCKSMANPTVAAATAAAYGVLQQMPCVPVITAPWLNCGQLKVMNMPVVLDKSKLMCMWGGQIEVSNPGNSADAKAD
ncbi:MAG: DUF4280 domain-containing protein [Muribaculaceae bacterium]|nr:DUF4280 domain-containing protein [Muribaculaceae bacterium]